MIEHVSAMPYATAPRLSASLAEDVYRRLRQDIVAGLYPPDTKLTIEELRAAYGAGASPVREALTRLAADRLVRAAPQRGFWVEGLSHEAFADITETRVRLETMALGDAMAKGDEGWEVGLVAAKHRLDRLAADDPLTRPSETWEARHREFHRALIAACGSPWLLHFLDLLMDQFDRIRRTAAVIATGATGLGVSHGELVEAALARRTAPARSLLEQHVRDTARIVQTALDRPADHALEKR